MGANAKGMHPEDIKSALRKRYRSLRAFEIVHGFSRGAVTEVLRNRRWAKVEAAIAADMGVPANTLFPLCGAADDATTEHLSDNGTATAATISGILNRVRAAARIIIRGTL
jgi:lambda repressor-like predicted transcriptional regulator